jgi:hypothetical protein
MDYPPSPPHRYAAPRLGATWYDLRGFLAARRPRLRDPRIALQGEVALGFSANGFLLEQPSQACGLNPDAAVALRRRTGSDKRMVRKLSWRTLWVVGLLWLIAVRWTGLLALGINIYFARFA